MYAINTFAIIILLAISIGIGMGLICTPIAFLLVYLKEKGVIKKIKNKLFNRIKFKNN